MRKYSIIIMLLLMILTFIGCGRKEEVKPTSPEPSATQPITIPTTIPVPDPMPTNVPDPSVESGTHDQNSETSESGISGSENTPTNDESNNNGANRSKSSNTRTRR